MLENYKPSEIVTAAKKEIAEENARFDHLDAELKDEITVKSHKETLKNKNQQIKFFSGLHNITVLGDEYMNIYASNSDQKFYLYQVWNSYGVWVTVDEMTKFLDSLPGSTKTELWHGSEEEYQELSKFQQAVNYVSENNITEEMIENLSDDVKKLYPSRSDFLC